MKDPPSGKGGRVKHAEKKARASMHGGTQSRQSAEGAAWRWEGGSASQRGGRSGGGHSQRRYYCKCV